MKLKYSAICFTLLLASASAMAVQIPPPGTEGLSLMVVSDGEVTATYQGYSALYSDDLIFNGNVIFNNKTSAVGSTVSLGTFTAGTVLDFSLYVHNTGNTFYSGDGSLNSDGKAHVRVQDAWGPDTTLVSFEDLNHGKFDYNDLVFSFGNTAVLTASAPAVPVPGAAWLLGSGLAGLVSIGRRKAK